ncbi:MAG: DEAD/DEAH box helicase family protein [Leptospiraceae bacterium]|nr:DEAD/DEAH box helicase family protein [Leptospiraceae bacterium]
MLNRYSSRIAKLEKKFLGQSFLNEKLKHADYYDRIAGYFSPSILQIAGESLGSLKRCRMVCNSQIVFSHISENQKISESAFKAEIWKEWCAMEPEKINIPGTLLETLYYLLDKKDKQTGEKFLEIRILPDDFFGLIHGKAGVITYKNGTKTSFMGSANESLNGWKLNYELVWEDDSQDSVKWVENEFSALWGHHSAFPLTKEVINDIKRNANRTIQTVKDWQEQPEVAAPIVESPVYRKHNGLWNHQKYFVSKAFHDHIQYNGARYILADQVGLGKTLQLAMSALLMALYGDFPVLVIAPKTLLKQWQEEFRSLLDAPSAIWTGKNWVDEMGIEYEKKGHAGIKNCPRKIGIVSQGLFSSKSKAVEYLLQQQYECIILDEAHRARRTNLNAKIEEERNPKLNNLMSYMTKITKKTKSLLLATATPVQIHPVEAWDLLSLLAVGKERIIGNIYSKWSEPGLALDAVMGNVTKMEISEFWQWLYNPFPPAEEKTRKGKADFSILRDSLNLKKDEFIANIDSFSELRPPDKRRIEGIKEYFFQDHNPFIRYIVRRTRSYLEETIDPETQKPFLPKVEVILFGENDSEAVELTSYLEDAYQLAREYCESLSENKTATGFFKTLLLRRIGSSIEAGRQTIEKLLNPKEQEMEEFWEEEDEGDDERESEELSSKEILVKLLKTLKANNTVDPKVQLVYDILVNGVNGTEPWLNRGCIIFSSYYASAYWLAMELSKRIPEIKIGLYAGSNKSMLIENEKGYRIDREEIKTRVKNYELKLIIGTDAASEGLNLQTLGTLINLDLPWNPTRLEQRKGRIQRIGQKYSKVYIYNMRYKDSVEDDVHKALSSRLESIHTLFGQLPDTLEDVWIQSAMGKIEEAKLILDSVPEKHPFDIKYNTSAFVQGEFWEQCSNVLNNLEKLDQLKTTW